MCVCECVHAFICMYMYVRMLVLYVGVCMYVIQARVFTYVCMCVCVYMRAYE